MNAKIREKMYRIAIVLSLTLVAIAMAATISLSQTRPGFISKGTLNSLGFGSYAVSTSTHCTRGSAFLASKNITGICTETFAPTNGSAAEIAPRLITLFTYSFSDSASASAYLKNITAIKNDASWQQGQNLSSNSKIQGKTTLYYTIISINSTLAQTTIVTAYLPAGATVMAASVLLPYKNGSITYGQALASSVLNAQYSNSGKSAPLMR